MTVSGAKRKIRAWHIQFCCVLHGTYSVLHGTCSVLQFRCVFAHFVTSCILSANILLSTLFLNTPSLCPSPDATNQVLPSSKKTNYNFVYFNLRSVCSTRLQLPHRMTANIPIGYPALHVFELSAGTCTFRKIRYYCSAFDITCCIFVSRAV